MLSLGISYLIFRTAGKQSNTVREQTAHRNKNLQVILLWSSGSTNDLMHLLHLWGYQTRSALILKTGPMQKLQCLFYTWTKGWLEGGAFSGGILLATCALDWLYTASHWSDHTTKQPSLLKQPLRQTALIWLCFSWDQTSVRALNLGQLSWEKKTFSLLTKSRLRQQSEGMVTLALLPLSWDLSGNHAK